LRIQALTISILPGSFWKIRNINYPEIPDWLNKRREFGCRDDPAEHLRQFIEELFFCFTQIMHAEGPWTILVFSTITFLFSMASVLIGMTFGILEPLYYPFHVIDFCGLML
jgi:hypothetical protein